MRVRLGGRYLTLRWVPRGRAIKNRGRDREPFGLRDHGLTDAPHLPNREILLRMGLSPLKELDATLHEFIHGQDWSKDEEWVEEAATDLARILIRLGWRRVGQKDQHK